MSLTIIAIVLIFIAALLNGGSEAYEADSSIFEKRFKVSETSWFGSRSWVRKYKDYPNDKSARFWLSKSALAILTDFAHFSEGVRNLFLIIGGISAGAVFIPGSTWACLIACLSFLIGFRVVSAVVYNLLRYKKIV